MLAPVGQGFSEPYCRRARAWYVVCDWIPCKQTSSTPSARLLLQLYSSRLPCEHPHLSAKGETHQTKTQKPCESEMCDRALAATLQRRVAVAPILPTKPSGFRLLLTQIMDTDARLVVLSAFSTSLRIFLVASLLSYQVLVYIFTLSGACEDTIILLRNLSMPPSPPALPQEASQSKVTEML